MDIEKIDNVENVPVPSESEKAAEEAARIARQRADEETAAREKEYRDEAERKDGKGNITDYSI